MWWLRYYQYWLVLGKKFHCRHFAFMPATTHPPLLYDRPQPSWHRLLLPAHITFDFLKNDVFPSLPPFSGYFSFLLFRFPNTTPLRVIKHNHNEVGPLIWSPVFGEKKMVPDTPSIKQLSPYRIDPSQKSPLVRC